MGRRNRDFFRPSWHLGAAAHPMNRRLLDPEIILQEGAYPNVGGELIFGETNLAALEVSGNADASVGSDVDAGMPKGARGEHGHPDIGVVATGGPHGEAGQ